MNAYGWIIAVALLLEYFLDMLGSYCNTTTLQQPLPPEFSGVFGTDRYRKSQAYTLATERFGMLSSTISLVLTFCFWFLGGFGFLDRLIRSLSLPVLPAGVLYIGALIVIRGIVSLPFSAYSTFIIEQRFGFNKTTVRTFCFDILKGLLLGILLGVPLLTAVLALFQYSGSLAWLWCWLTAVAFMLAVHFIAPVWILPLFNKFTPLAEGDLRSAISAYAKSVGFAYRDISVMDGSKRSTKSNAFFTGFGRNKRIALFDTLIARHTVGELVCILAHEIGHYKKRHILKGLGLGIAHTGLLLYALSLFVGSSGLTEAFFIREHSVYAAIALFGFLAIPLEFFISLGLQAVSRKHEYEADRYAAGTTGQPGIMIEALKKLSADNLSHLTPHPLTVALNYSHPPVLARIQALENMEKQGA